MAMVDTTLFDLLPCHARSGCPFTRVDIARKLHTERGRMMIPGVAPEFLREADEAIADLARDGVIEEIHGPLGGRQWVLAH